MSRYYAKEIQMHSYDNGIGAKTKKDNWAQLLKVFRKTGLNDLTNENEVHLISTAEDGAAVVFISKLYEVLTQRVVQTQVKKPSMGREPGYLKEISLNKVRKALHRNDLGEDSDINTISRVAFGAVDSHERALQEDRLHDPDRYSTATHILNPGVRTSQVMQSKPTVDHDVTQPQVKVKEIQVKQLDRNVTHLRAMKQMQQNNSYAGRGSDEPRAVSPSGNEYGGGRESPMSVQISQQSFEMPSPTSKSGRGMNPDNSLSMINTCLARIMQPDCFPNWSARLDPYNNFLAAVNYIKAGRHIEDLLRECLAEIGNSAQMLAEAAVVAPKQYWMVSDIFCAVLVNAPFVSPTFAAAISSFESIGKWIAVKDPVTSLTLFYDFTFFKLTETVLKNMQKRNGIMKLLHAFAPQDSQSHVQIIKRLQACIGDQATFIHCLSILAINETETDDELLDLYFYYASIAMGMSSPKLRAGAVALLSAFVGRADSLIIPLLGQIRTLSQTETWWEIHAHILSLCGSLLASVYSSGTGQGPTHLSGGINDNWSQQCDVGIVDEVRDIVNIVLRRAQNSKVLMRWAASALAGGTFLGDGFNDSYITILESLSDKDRAVILNGSSAGASRDSRRAVNNDCIVVLPSATGSQLTLASVTATWHPMAVLESLASAINGKEKLVDRMTSAQMNIVYSCFQSAIDSAKRTGAPLDEIFQGTWLGSFEALKSYIFVAFCDIASSKFASSICSALLYYSSIREKLFQEVKLVGAMRLLYPLNAPQGDTVQCQGLMEAFLRECFQNGVPFNSAVVSLLTQFSQNYASQFDKYMTLQQLLREFSRQMR
jgi:hypothetical protein